MRRRKPWHLFDPRHIGIILGDGQLHTPQRFGVYTSLSGHRFGVYTSLCPQALGVYTSLSLFPGMYIIKVHPPGLVFYALLCIICGLSTLGGYGPGVI